ncbi:helix-turn-helix domain-containing protein, partial [Enterococcus faecium]
IGNPSLNHRYRKGFYSLFKTLQQNHLIVERTKEGLKSARARGRKGGRPRVNQKDVDRAVKLYKSQVYSVKEITEMTGISKATLYRYLKDNRE